MLCLSVAAVNISLFMKCTSKDLRNQQVFELRFDPFDETITVTNQVISKVTRKSPLYFIAYKG